MTKRILRVALVAAAAVSFAAPAAPASASCLDQSTYVGWCLLGSVQTTELCVPWGSEYEICVL